MPRELQLLGPRPRQCNLRGGSFIGICRTKSSWGIGRRGPSWWSARGQGEPPPSGSICAGRTPRIDRRRPPCNVPTRSAVMSPPTLPEARVGETRIERAWGASPAGVQVRCVYRFRHSPTPTPGWATSKLSRWPRTGQRMPTIRTGPVGNDFQAMPSVEKPGDTALLQAKCHVTFGRIGALRDNQFPQIAGTCAESLPHAAKSVEKQGALHAVMGTSPSGVGRASVACRYSGNRGWADARGCRTPSQRRSARQAATSP